MSLQPLTDADLEAERKNAAFRRERRLDDHLNIGTVCVIWCVLVGALLVAAFCIFMICWHIIDPTIISDSAAESMISLCKYLAAAGGGYLARLAQRATK